MSSQSATAPSKLPFWQTVGACYVTVIRNFGQLLRISWLWLLIMLPLYAVVHWLTWAPTTAGAPEMNGMALIIAGLPSVIELPALASIAVAWHRLVLREEATSGAFYLRLDGMVCRYALILLVLFVLVGAPVAFALPGVLSAPHNPEMAAGVIFVLGAVATLAIAGFVLPRLSLVLPAVALGEGLSAAAAWGVSRGNTWRLLWATLLCSLPLYALFLTPLELFVRDETQASAAVVGTIGSLINVLVVTVGVTLLSLSYRHFVRREDWGGLGQQPGARGPAAA